MMERYGLSPVQAVSEAAKLISNLRDAHLDIVLDTWIEDADHKVATKNRDFWAGVEKLAQEMEVSDWKPWRPYEQSDP